MSKFTKGQTFTHPTEGTKWVAGGQGKPPGWVSDMVAGKTVRTSYKVVSAFVPEIATPVMAVPPPADFVPFPAPAPVVPTGLKVWKYKGEDGTTQAKIVVVANDQREALENLNRTFKSGVSLPEWIGHWAKVEDASNLGSFINLDSPGVWNVVGGVWTARKRA